ncbi:hypothetical protein D1614_03095 [Maribellus luteus]|uniref:Membrane or secreted protein n=1 Tax=Maribellus luteus TaxID=2305463 RepID=A0A399T6F6_9BACT|nr:hypothetical protein [Maribellus luteus]RIJ49741.1 hypothetical protein D1614_03095 [Maribellus luteus]
MYLKILIVTIILVAIMTLALGVKLLFNKDASFTGHACSFDESKLDQDGSCAGCGIQDITNCPEKES